MNQVIRQDPLEFSVFRCVVVLHWNACMPRECTICYGYFSSYYAFSRFLISGIIIISTFFFFFCFLG